MADRKYTLELTAEELINGPTSFGYIGKVFEDKLAALQKQAKADREADDLRLPWRAELVENSIKPFWRVHFTPRNLPTDYVEVHHERTAKLMSAAPELLEAVQAVMDYQSTLCFERSVIEQQRWQTVIPLCLRALRKVETGIPEDKP